MSSNPIDQQHRKFTVDVASLIGGQGIITILALINTVVMARALGAEGRGYFAMAMLLSAMLVAFSDFGLGTAGTRFIASKKREASTVFASNALIALIRIPILGLLGMGLIYWGSDFFFPGVPNKYLYLGLLQVIHLVIASLLFPILLGVGKGVTYSLILVGSSAFSVFTLAMGWLIFGLNVELALMIQVVSSLMVSSYICFTVIKAIEQFKKPNLLYIKEAFGFGLGIYASSVTNFAGTKLILLIINAFGGAVAVGLYTIAQTATEKLYLIADAVGTMLLPKIAENPKENSNKITPIVFRITIVTVIMMATVLAILSNWIINFLFSDSFADAAKIMRLLLVSAIFSSGWLVLSQDLNARGLSKTTAIINTITTVLSLGSAFILLPIIGLDGAAWATIIASTFSLFAGIWVFGHQNESSSGTQLLFTISSQERSIMKKIIRGLTYILSSGPTFWWALTRAYLVDSLMFKMAKITKPVKGRLKVLLENFSFAKESRQVASLAVRITSREPSIDCVNLNELGLTEEALLQVEEALKQTDIVSLGEFDHYGRLIPEFGDISQLYCISREESRPREKAKVQLVATIKGIGIKKEFHKADKQKRFVREVLILEHLRASEVNTPELLHIDPETPSLVESFILGTDLEQILTIMGAELTGAACIKRLGGEPTFQEIEHEYIKEGSTIAKKLSSTLIDSIHDQVKSMHRAGVHLYDLKYGNIVIHDKTKKPYLIDFDSAQLFSNPQSLTFLIRRDIDTKKLNLLFNKDYPTYENIIDKIKNKSFPAAAELYASTYIGHGLFIGSLWDRTTGFGRWNFILKKRLKVKEGDRILSLGPNNASIEIQLLREGAGEIIAYERNKEFMAQGIFLKNACEWADNKKYNLNYVLADMLKSVNAEGTFDSVMALCSLYYLSDDDMNTVAKAISTKSQQFILQCNMQQGIGRDNEDDYQRASLSYAKNLLNSYGYTQQQVASPKNYSRPLVIGNKVNAKLN